MKRKRSNFIKNKLVRFTKNPFMTLRVSGTRLAMFTSDHMHRMKAPNNPAFAQIILATEQLYESIFGRIEARDNDFNDQQSYTIQVNQKIKEFTTKVLEMESLVCIKFGKKSATWQEFYPHGRTEYYRVNKTNIMLMFERIIKLTTDYESQLGSDPKNEFTQMYNEFMPLYETHMQLKGAVAGFKPNYQALKTTLCIQLYQNLLTILACNPKQPERVFSYFDGTIVGWAVYKKKKKKVQTPVQPA